MFEKHWASRVSHKATQSLLKGILNEIHLSFPYLAEMHCGVCFLPYLTYSSEIW